MGYSASKSVLKLTRYSGRRSRICMPACGGRNSSRGDASRRSALAPMARGVGVELELLAAEQV